MRHWGTLFEGRESNTRNRLLGEVMEALPVEV